MIRVEPSASEEVGEFNRRWNDLFDRIMSGWYSQQEFAAREALFDGYRPSGLVLETVHGRREWKLWAYQGTHKVCLFMGNGYGLPIRAYWGPA